MFNNTSGFLAAAARTSLGVCVCLVGGKKREKNIQTTMAIDLDFLCQFSFPVDQTQGI